METDAGACFTVSWALPRRVRADSSRVKRGRGRGVVPWFRGETGVSPGVSPAVDPATVGPASVGPASMGPTIVLCSVSGRGFLPRFPAPANGDSSSAAVPSSASYHWHWKSRRQASRSSGASSPIACSPSPPSDSSRKLADGRCSFAAWVPPTSLSNRRVGKRAEERFQSHSSSSFRAISVAGQRPV
ncbi:hypothetical protein JZ751_003316 [Albula glossodonta]|uniref:Uncharacterized protein n=1 Tax=Albula glossodonta TaxID=121402 RepID=A0A8T2N9K3_9TELE|nr:hypothetical protein JZ751_003316 [Albula glossodonta]